MNKVGQLGIGTDVSFLSTPTLVVTASVPILSICAGATMSMGLSAFLGHWSFFKKIQIGSNGRVYSWGYNLQGNLGVLASFPGSGIDIVNRFSPYFFCPLSIFGFQVHANYG